jgi:hypothetical protein
VTDNSAALAAQSSAGASSGEIVLGGVDLPEMRDNLSLVAAGPGGGARALPRVVGNGEPERYTVPAPGRNTLPRLAAGQFANYVVAHSEYAAPLNRRNVLSALVASEADPSVAPAPVPAAQPDGAPR